MPFITKARKKVDPFPRGKTSKLTQYENQMIQIYKKALSQIPKDLDNEKVLRAMLEGIEAGNPMTAAIALSWRNFVSSLDKSVPTMAQQLAASANISAKNLPKKIRIESNFTGKDPRAIAWAQQRAGARILGITKETQKAVAETIAAGLKTKLKKEEVIERIRKIVGLDSKQAKALGNFYEKNLMKFLDDGLTYEEAVKKATRLGERYRSRLLIQRATRIARTETAAAANAGRMLSWAEADAQGFLPVGSEKRWKTATDERTCPICGPLHNTTVGWEDSFSTGDLMPPNHPNCRCTAVIVPAEPTYEKSIYLAPMKTNRNYWLFEKHAPGKHNQQNHAGGRSGGTGGGSLWSKDNNFKLNYDENNKMWQTYDDRYDYNIEDEYDPKIEAVNSYVEIGYEEMNGLSRGKSLEPYENKVAIEGQIANLDKAILESPDIIGEKNLYRVYSNRVLENLEEGDVVVDKGFLSTTRIDITADDLSARNTRERLGLINPSADTTAVILPNPSKSGKGLMVDNYLLANGVSIAGTNVEREFEVILPRNTALTFLGYEGSFQEKVAIFQRND